VAAAPETERRLGAGIWTLLKLLPEVSRPLTLTLFVASALSGVLPVFVTIAAGHLVGATPKALGSGLGSPAGHHLLALLGLVAVAMIAAQLGQMTLLTVGTMLGRRTEARLQARAMAASLGPDGIAHLEDADVRDSITLIREPAPGQRTPSAAVEALGPTINNKLTSISGSVLVATYSLPLGLLLLVTWAVAQTQLMRYIVRALEAQVVGSRPLRRALYFRDLALRPSAAKEVRVFGLGSWVASRFVAGWQETAALLWQARAKGRYLTYLASSISYASLFGGLAWAGLQASHRHIGLGAFAVLIGAIIQANGTSAGDTDVALAYGAVTVPAILALEQRAFKDALPVPATPASLADSAPIDAVRFEAVSFGYGGATVLRDLDLTIPAGQSLALVGVNGAGKSTIVKLLARLYDPTSGRVMVDGVDLREVDPSAWRRHLAVLFQDFVHYQLSVADNVGFGAADLERDDVRLESSLQRAGGLDVLDTFPDGWDTVLTATVVAGTDLSGGQWQRLALARALHAVQAGARLLVLDEPTANLDVRGEAQLYDRFLEVTEGLTTVLVSHRFSTVRLAARIVVLESGGVVEQGTHDELMDANGRYRSMFMAQAERFGSPRA
jgi:ATP-binding cassette, subfamily B, bacterial